VSRCLSVLGGWSNVLAGISLVISFSTYFVALQVHHCDPRDREPCAPDNQAIVFWGHQGDRAVYETAHWFMFLEGIFWMIGGVAGACTHIQADVAILAASQTLIAFGGFFFACSAWGNPANVISLRYLVPIAYLDESGTDPKIWTSFSDVAPFYGIFCFMIATTMGMVAVAEAPRGKLCSPFYGVLSYWIGAWIIGVITLYVPMLAGGLTRYEDLSMSCEDGAGKCILDVPIIAWYPLKIWAVIGALFLTAGAIIFGVLDKIWLLGAPSEVHRKKAVEV